MQKKPLQFKISSALKNIIGSDLISDDFIAVFELVKNSYDAHATKVEITFEDIYSDNAKIIIKDNGKGMNFDDLINKWLFVAYSAKKEGTEEDSYDYRDKIKVQRAYAGAKGIGRFSCDRLGGELYLETIKDEENPKVETLLTEWDKFEGNLKEEFVNISVLHETIPNSNYDIEHGTVLEISNLKSDWDKDKFLSLKDALAKLINPNTKIEGDEFTIELIVPDEIENDKKESDYQNTVNGKIQNLIFETLEIKTTKIVSSIYDGKITTELTEGGKLVYKIIESNSYEHLNNVAIQIYHLNRSAKATFTRRMGTRAVDYGHVFVYKNGLRIYPYGERGEDPFKMDNRKAQGHSRYLGTRDVLGYISISEPNEELKETSSRGDGLIKTKTYFELVDWVYSSIRKLEKYIIDITDWGNELSNEDYIKLDNERQQEAIEKLIESLTKSKNILSFEVAPEIFEIIDEKQEKSTKNTLTKIKKQLQSDEYDKDAIVESISKIEKNLDELKKTTEEAGEEALDSLIKNEELETNLETEKKKGAFQGALIGTDKERIVGLQHQIYHSSSRVTRNLKLLIKHLGSENLDTKTKKYIKTISLEASKINSIANFVTKANFNLKASEIETDLVDFIIDYIKELYLLEDKVIDTSMNIIINDNYKKEFVRELRPLEITTIIDNLISNSEKANASEVKIGFNKRKDNLVISFEDNGKGIPEKNLTKVYDLGYTTTSGSGIGLYQVNDLVKNSLKGKIEIESQEKKGTIIKIILG
ncbi:histidine kinase [Mangrovimonas yunxiaonensis]|uniref:Histidine kinase n=1 Tax=Mangrovimonas yunxiaonensis TaxID=1197477 RepID=A0A084TK27_9FLAO|nr:ATP-binding protein [Mangrovimonas yunxiaonensis]KFB01063.1 histidine kinase [Mangrovimonas yunxiaonensis]GGH48270.1 histidine kinase [Mangrovimonas yunxiaonensis]